MSKIERVVIFILRFSAIIMGFASIAVFMPSAWMEETHKWLGIGDFPKGPITYYLARSLSAFYVIYGGLLWLTSFNIKQYYNIIVYLAYTGLALGPTLLFIDISSNMPYYWTFGEGPSIFIFSIILIILLKKIRKSDS